MKGNCGSSCKGYRGKNKKRGKRQYVQSRDGVYYILIFASPE